MCVIPSLCVVTFAAVAVHHFAERAVPRVRLLQLAAHAVELLLVGAAYLHQLALHLLQDREVV